MPGSMILETKRMTKYSIKKANSTFLLDNSNLFRPISWNPSNQLTSIIDIIKDRLIRLEIEHNQDKWITANIWDITTVSTRRVAIDSRPLTATGVDMKSKTTTTMDGTLVTTTISIGTATIVGRRTGTTKQRLNHLYVTKKVLADSTIHRPLILPIVLLKAIVDM